MHHALAKHSFGEIRVSLGDFRGDFGAQAFQFLSVGGQGLGNLISDIEIEAGEGAAVTVRLPNTPV